MTSLRRHLVHWLTLLGRRLASPFRVFAGEAHRWDADPTGQTGLSDPRQPDPRPLAPGGSALPGGPAPVDEAHRLQAALLPVGFPIDRRFSLFAASEPARIVGGDSFDFFVTPSGRLAIIVADASGKGVPAAMFIAATRAVLREVVMSGAGPARALERANAMLLAANPLCMFVTVFLAVYDPDTGVLVAASAGHPWPVLIRPPATALGSSRGPGSAPGEATELTPPARSPSSPSPAPSGTVLGVVEGLTFSEHAFQLVIGDRLLVYSDGVTEARAPRSAPRPGEFLRIEGVLAIAATHAGQDAEDLVRTILSEVNRHQLGILHDDATALVLERRA